MCFRMPVPTECMPNPLTLIYLRFKYGITFLSTVCNNSSFLTRRTTLYSTSLLTMLIPHFTCHSRLPFVVVNYQHHTKQCCKCCAYARLHYIPIEFAEIKTLLLLKDSFTKVILDLILLIFRFIVLL